MKTLNIALILILSTMFFSACEDKIDMNIKDGEQALVVEGWLTNKPENHYVKIYLTKALSSSSSFEQVTGAAVTLKDDAGNTEVLHEKEPGKYEIAVIKGVEGRTYTLRIQSSEGTYEAISKMPRLSMAPDSLTFKYEEKSIVYEDAGYYPYIYGQEIPGEGDYIQVKLYNNDKYLNKPADINIFSDEFVDGNYINNTELSVDTPFVAGDMVKAEVWSQTEEAYHFWTDLRTQLQNGGIFASPMTNTRTNIKSLTPGARKANGFFGTSLVATAERKVE